MSSRDDLGARFQHRSLSRHHSPPLRRSYVMSDLYGTRARVVLLFDADEPLVLLRDAASRTTSFVLDTWEIEVSFAGQHCCMSLNTRCPRDIRIRELQLFPVHEDQRRMRYSGLRPLYRWSDASERTALRPDDERGKQQRLARDRRRRREIASRTSCRETVPSSNNERMLRNKTSNVSALTCKHTTLTRPAADRRMCEGHAGPAGHVGRRRRRCR